MTASLANFKPSIFCNDVDDILNFHGASMQLQRFYVNQFSGLVQSCTREPKCFGTILRDGTGLETSGSIKMVEPARDKYQPFILSLIMFHIVINT